MPSKYTCKWASIGHHNHAGSWLVNHDHASPIQHLPGYIVQSWLLNVIRGTVEETPIPVHQGNLPSHDQPCFAPAAKSAGVLLHVVLPFCVTSVQKKRVMLIESNCYQSNSETRSQKLSHFLFNSIRYFSGLTEQMPGGITRHRIQQLPPRHPPPKRRSEQKSENRAIFLQG